ncbi:MAG: TolC family protein [Gammaproteobacteria bacterium]
MLYLYYKNNNFSLAYFKSCLVFILVFILSACAKQQYVSESIDIQQNVEDIVLKDHRSQQFKSFLEQHQFPSDNWPITQWDLNSLTLAAVYFNEKVNVAKSELEIQKAGEIIAGQRPNPTVAIPLENYSGSAESPWLIGLVFDFLFEREDKREAKKQQALAKRNAAEIKLQQQVWSIYSDLHKNFIEYFSAIKQKEILLAQRKLLQESLDLLIRRKELGQVSQFELSRIRLELQHLQLQLSDQNYIINNAFHELITVTGLQADKFDKNDFEFNAFNKTITLSEYDEIKLRESLLSNRHEIKIKLKEYDALEAALKLEILKQYPDVNLSPGFIFDQGSNVWALGSSWVLPLFHNHEGEIEQALAMRKKLQAEFIVMQTNLINELSRRHQNYIDKMASYENSILLLKELEQRANQIQKQFDLGYADKLSLVQVTLEIEKVKQAVFSIKVDVLRTIEELERITQQSFNNAGVINSIMETL